MVFEKELKERLTWKEQKWYNNNVWRKCERVNYFSLPFFLCHK
jgi:hypothetical protein